MNVIDNPVRSGLFDAHDALRRLGAAEARRTAGSTLERICIDAAAAVIEAPVDPSRLIYGSIALTYMPYRDPGPEYPLWNARCGHTNFTLTPGPSGYPFGAKARVLLLHLVDRAIRSGSSVAEIGPSMRSWLQSMGIALGGMTYSHIGEQSRRIAGCGLRIVPASDQSEALALLAREVNGFIESFELDSEDGKTEVVSPEGVVFAPTFPKRTRLDPGFFDYVSASRVALDRVAIQQISDNGWALDLYIWLATELPALAAPLQISWPMFFEGFGDQGPRHRIKAKALSTLPLVAAVYPDARIRVDQDGLLLLPSPPAMFA